MRITVHRAFSLLLTALIAVPMLLSADGDDPAERRREAYYRFALGHLYHHFAQQFMRQEYVDRAVEEYTAALEADPESHVIRIEMINLFAGANRLAEAEAVAAKVLEDEPDNAEVHGLLGRIYRSYATKQRQGVNQEYLQKALERFEKLAEIEPDKAENHLDLGSLYRSAGRPEDAERSLRRALDLDPGHADAQVGLAYMLLEAGKIDTAVATLEEIVQAGTGDGRHINALAGAYEQLGRFREAAEMYEKLVGQGGSNLNVLQLLAENLFRSRQYARALDLFEALAKTDAENPRYHLRISQIQGERESYAEAWKALESALKLDPGSLEVQFQAIGLLEAEGQLGKAAERTKSLLNSTRKSEYAPGERGRRIVLLERLGVLRRELDQSEAAVAAFRQIAALDPETKPQVLAQVIETWRAARDYARAEREGRKAVEEFAGNPMLIHSLATVLSDRGKTKEAVRVVEELRRNNPEEIDGHLAIAGIYEKGRQFENAKKAIDRASELAKSDAERVRVLFAYGSMHERAREYEKAEAYFRDLIQIDPDNAGALNYLGYMFADQSVHLEEAHEMIQKALDMEPDNGAYLDSLGWVYYRQDKLDLAAKFLERSLKQYQDDPVVHSHLGDVYFKQGRVDAAREHWRRGLKEWTRSAPADRDDDEIAILRRKLDELKVSASNDAPKRRKKSSVER